MFEELRNTVSDSPYRFQVMRRAAESGFISSFDEATIDDPEAFEEEPAEDEVIDELAVELVATGTRPDMAAGLTRPERVEAVRLMKTFRLSGLTHNDMAQRLGISEKQVKRIDRELAAQ